MVLLVIITTLSLELFPEAFIDCTCPLEKFPDEFGSFKKEVYLNV